MRADARAPAQARGQRRRGAGLGARETIIAVEISKSKITVVTKWEIVYSVPPHN